MIRHASPGDASALAELAARTFHETFAADNRPEDMALHAAESYGERQQHQEIVNPDIITLLLETDGALIGYAQLRSGAPPECVAGPSPIELWRFYIARSHHGRGAAQTLMTRVFEEARHRGSRTMWLGVWEKNERAQAFYRKVGFVDVGAHVYMVGTDAQTDRIMVQTLSPDPAA